MKIIITFLFVFFLYLSVFAQIAPEPNNQLENTEIVIEKNKKIIFPELNKVTEKANISKKQINTLEQQKYSFIEHPSLLPNVESKVRVPAIKETSELGNRPHFIKLGFGNYLTTFAEGYVSSNSLKPWQLSLHAKHFASATGPLDFSGNSMNGIKTEARYAFKKSILRWNFGYNRVGFRFYGYGNNKPNESFKDTLFQAYNYLNTNLYFSKIDTNSKWFYNSFVKFNFMNSKKFVNTEQDLNIQTNISYEIDEFKKVNFDVNANLILNSIPQTNDRSIYKFKPTFEYKFNDKLKFNFGFALFYNKIKDTLNIEKKIRLYPHIDAEYNVLENIKIYGIMSGGTIKNSYSDLSLENPFLSNQLSLAHSNQKFIFTLGMKGALSRIFYSNISFSYQNVDNLLLYAPSMSDSSRFNTVYNQGSILNANGEIRFQKSEKFSIGLKLNYNSFSLQNNQKAWLRPNFEAALVSNFVVSKRLDFYAEAFVLEGLYSKNFISGNERKLNTIVDINIKSNYKLNNRLSIYLYLFNILGNKYERFINYPIKSINFVGGLTISF